MVFGLFKKTNQRRRAFESYLAHFSEPELSYLNDIALTSLYDNGLPGHDAEACLEVATYVHAAMVAAQSADPRASDDQWRTRSKVRISLAAAMTSFRKRLTRQDISRLTYEYRSNTPYPPDYDANDRLDLHNLMLSRIFRDPFAAPYFPELDEYGEGEAWLDGWRK